MINHSVLRHSVLLGLTSALLGTPALAESDLRIGLSASANTSLYEGVGSEQYLFPLLFLEQDRLYFHGIRGGYRFLRDDQGQSLALEVRRTFDGYDHDDSAALAGMADRKPAWEVGLVHEFGVAGGQIKTSLMHDVSDRHNGFSAKGEFERPLLQQENYQLSWYAGLEYWSDGKADYYFGVDHLEARPRRPDYDPEEVYFLSLGGNAAMRIDERFSVVFNAEYSLASDGVGDSPLVTRRDQWSAYGGLFYRF
jgi:outer membrane protein